MGRFPTDRSICATLLVLLISVRSVAAQPSVADEAFQRGREALKVGNYIEACAAFEEAQRLDPQLTTQFNIALCDEQLGKLATALAIHRELASKDDNLPRRAKAADMVAELEGRVPRLRIEVAKAEAQLPPGLEVTVNGVRAANFKDMPIDLGVSHVIAHAPGFVEWRGDVTAKEERQKVVVTVTLVPVGQDGSSTLMPIEPATPPGDQPPSSTRRKLGVAGMVVGGVALAGGVAYGLLARSKWNDAKALCGGTTCETQSDLDRGQDLVKEARKRGTISTALFVGGGVIAAAGVVLWVTAPKAERAVALAPAASTSSVGVALLGRF